MPDKEFDNLFRDRFKDAEITPSANLWANIEQQLAPKRKRTFPIYWMAAATIAVAFTAMLAFQKTEKIQLRLDQVTAKVPAVNTQETQDITVTRTDESASPVNETVVNKNSLAAVQVKTPSVKAVLVAKTEDDQKNIEMAMQPNVNNNRLAIKQAEVKPLDVLPVKEVLVENPTVIAAVAEKPKFESGQITETESSTERKGIRNVGDLVNFVVDKVDKREKKFLKFSTDDDDNSSIIGINIGFLKLNSKKHK
ncbi:hypothetical protein [Pedobacter sp. Hv1]|uniref:hypothetical protein n=1 Tax=Pedobacter sp. Hv1 TaxID=1740090 RepID=UPI0006D8B505|nr:hypothetical protein [Pedobacter sp. Hv1]KQC02473.1 hypothetical protein AQF98_02530 [Pedobacter sp. Hv1]